MNVRFTFGLLHKTMLVKQDEPSTCQKLSGLHDQHKVHYSCWLSKRFANIFQHQHHCKVDLYSAQSADISAVSYTTTQLFFQQVKNLLSYTTDFIQALQIRPWIMPRYKFSKGIQLAHYTRTSKTDQRRPLFTTGLQLAIIFMIN